MYESLTAFIEKLDDDDYGTWYVDKENDGSAEHPIQIPFVMYDRVVTELIKETNRFVVEHREMGLTSYRHILEENGISSMSDVDVTALDGQVVMALLVCVVRCDRFFEGTLLEFLENGSIKRWLERLRELEPDKNNIEGMASKTDEYIARHSPSNPESTTDIIVFPEYEDLKNETEKLRTELSMLLLERDELEYVICRNLETEYMLKIGGLEHQLYAKQCDVQRLKRELELIQAALNRHEKPDVKEINRLLDKEFTSWRAKLDEMMNRMNEALKRSKNKVLSPEETRELKTLYRKIVKALHPDLHPDIPVAQLRLFEHAVTAYKNGDLLSIRVIYETIGGDSFVYHDADTMEMLIKTKKHLEKLFIKINAEIADIKSRYPYTEKEFLSDDEKVEERRQQLKNKLEQYQELSNKYLDQIFAALKG